MTDRSEPSDTSHPKRATEAFYGRRKGKHLRDQHQMALAEVLPALKLDLSQAPPDHIDQLWTQPGSGVRLEIGFGGGEHLLHRIKEAPMTHFIGIEPFVNSMAKLVRAVQLDPVHNLRLFDDDATLVLDWLPDHSIDHIDLLYPDPWPKKRHWKRRFVNDKNLNRFARVLKPGGKFCFASDIDTYVNWTLEHIMAHPDFMWDAQGPDNWHIAWANWPSTRYEAKALREGRTPAYFTFIRHSTTG